ncbi:MAG: type II secretion system protein [Peptostreptococcaceae bacterium]
MNKNNGFALIECIVSMFIIMLLGSIIGISLQSAYQFTEINKTNIEIINVTEKYINDKKYAIKKSDTEINNLYEKTNVDGYEIESNIKKVENYNQCYELNVIVNYKNKNIEINTYVTQE